MNDVQSVPGWRNATFALTFGGLLVSLGGNLSQHHFAQKAAENSAAELKLNQDKFSVERDKLTAEADKLKAELAALQQNSQNTASDRAAIQSELDKINGDIRTYDAAIQKHQIQLKMDDFSAQMEAEGKDNAKAETAKHIADTERSTLETFVGYRNDAAKRRDELERRLSGKC